MLGHIAQYASTGISPSHFETRNAGFFTIHQGEIKASDPGAA
ncbi:MAG TPA: hypothetical protein VGG14_01455 [Candidatus Sulfotelmatobacter sp.]